MRAMQQETTLATTKRRGAPTRGAQGSAAARSAQALVVAVGVEAAPEAEPVVADTKKPAVAEAPRAGQMALF